MQHMCTNFLDLACVIHNMVTMMNDNHDNEDSAINGWSMSPESDVNKSKIITMMISEVTQQTQNCEIII